MHIILGHDVFGHNIVPGAYHSWDISFPGAYDFLRRFILRSYSFLGTLFLHIISAEH